ncbi:RES domain-containing protein [Aureitalea sp. L0-47]|uniref:RES domain-containing protein n=1 Tax=Aureitalea sp. L0-47 TaxID=2816962 RepID=UPI00223747E0|nr:RES domain-containing protein [Aureitalea sp. L0-47]MCW5518497.1 RES domain-containing protein [Aureitalea sp. L0-47]
MDRALEIIDRLRILKDKNTAESYAHIKNILKNQRIPLPLFDIQEFERVKLVRYRRHNNGEDYFRNIEDLTYRKDILLISHFGRCNEPGQGIFYCNDHNNQETGIVESVSVFRGNADSQEEVFTIGAWSLTKPLRLGMILPLELNRGKNPQFDQMRESFMQFENSEYFEELMELVDYLALEFSLDLEKQDSNYLITSAFTNYFREVFDVDGLLYASVKADLEGTNIVLWPESVDNKLEFYAARKQSFQRDPGTNSFWQIGSEETESFDLNTGIINW